MYKTIINKISSFVFFQSTLSFTIKHLNKFTTVNFELIHQKPLVFISKKINLMAAYFFSYKKEYITAQSAQALAIFNNALQWNFFFYVFHKLYSLAITLFLTKKMDGNLTACWVQVYSIVYLALLWIDFGNRKSLPLFLSLMHDKKSREEIINATYMRHALTLIVSMPIITIMVYFSSLATQWPPYVFMLLPIIMTLEGISSHAQTLLHAQNRQKYCNLKASLALALELALISCVLIEITNQVTLLYAILGIKIICSGMLILTIMPQTQLNSVSTLQLSNKKKIPLNIVQHSLIATGTTIAKSLSERNVITLVITAAAGPEAAISYKIANDGALFLQRCIVKIMNNADISFYATIRQSEEPTKQMKVACSIVSARITALIIPLLLGTLLYYYFLWWLNIKTKMIFFTACLLSISYAIESMLMPYERILEACQCYRSLLRVYILYSTLVIFSILLSYNAFIGTGVLLILITGVRLVSYLLFFFYARKHVLYPRELESIY